MNKLKEEYSISMKAIWAKGTLLNTEQSIRVVESWKRPDVWLSRSIGIKRAYNTTDLREKDLNE